MSIKKRFSEDDLKKIKAAVHQAEDKISGEIVPVFVERSGHYVGAVYRGGLILGALTFILLIYFDRYQYQSELAIVDPLLIFLVVIAAGLTGALFVNYVDPLRRMLVGQAELDHSTKRRAESAFLQEEIFNTQQRTGIMIFVSFFEREVIIIADRGISKVVDQKEWDKMVFSITDHIRKGKIVEGISGAIVRCGNILLEKGFVKAEADVNELKDDLRIED